MAYNRLRLKDKYIKQTVNTDEKEAEITQSKKPQTVSSKNSLPP